MTSFPIIDHTVKLFTPPRSWRLAPLVVPLPQQPLITRTNPQITVNHLSFLLFAGHIFRMFIQIKSAGQVANSPLFLLFYFAVQFPGNCVPAININCPKKDSLSARFGSWNLQISQNILAACFRTEI
jgi:hypothetical protein